MVSETFIVNQITSLLDSGHAVTIFSYYPGDDETLHPKVVEYDLLSRTHVFKAKPESILKRLIFFLGFTFKNLFRINAKTYFRSLNIFKFRRKALNLSIFYEAKWFVNRKDFDIVHVHFGVNAKRIAYLKYLGFLKQTRLVTTFHGYGLIPNQVSRYQLIYRHIFNFSDVITVNTDYLKQVLVKMEVEGEKIHILPVGLDTDYFKSDGQIKDGKTIIFCGRLIPLKAPDTAIEIVNRLVKNGFSEIRLVLIGDGEMKDQLKDQVKTYNLEGHVVLMGSQPQNIILSEMDKASVFILPGIKDPNNGRAEAQGLVIQEAQSMKLPVVVSNVGGMKYGLLQDKTGFVVEEGDIEAYVDKITLLLNNDNLRNTMGREGRRFVQKNYDNMVLGDKLIDIYRNCH
ncbi:MAG: glycosyltransferase family 4 protein [Aureisphaera sp.]